MNEPWCSRAKARLAKCEAKLIVIKTRKARTRLVEIEYQGVRHGGAKEALKAASDFYTRLFAAGVDSPLDRLVDRRFSPEEAEALCAPWEEAEVKRALAEMAPGKTPGRDGLPKELWESQWDLLGGQMMQFLKEFERMGSLFKEFSTAVTVLLHKKGAKDDLQNYRPITLPSTVYKLIAKVLANRVKGKLEKVVSAGQFGFSPGRSIAGAVAVAADVIDAANAEQEDWLISWWISARPLTQWRGGTCLTCCGRWASRRRT
ncbi:unnamed protein product [Closterium sp. Yama58-4]|nr:unnamed protein product [Closterium sp. Yama58-4]